MLGISGTNYILSSIARVRARAKLIVGARAVATENSYIVELYGPEADCPSRSVQLCDPLDWSGPLTFRTAEAATKKIASLGLQAL
jgi:hypothetical protein